MNDFHSFCLNKFDIILRSSNDVGIITIAFNNSHRKKIRGKVTISSPFLINNYQ